jgi:hypothetical protein
MGCGLRWAVICVDKFTEFIRTRAVLECRPYYRKNQTPENFPGLFCIVPKALYEEYMQLKRRSANQREPRDLPTVTLDRSTAKIRIEHYPAKVFLGGWWYETIIQEEIEETLPHFISYNQRGYEVYAHRMIYLPAFAKIPDPNSVEITYRYENWEERTAEFYVGDKIGDKYVLMQKDADVCVVVQKDAEAKKRKGFFGLFRNRR